MKFFKNKKKYLIILFLIIFVVYYVIDIRKTDQLSQQKVKFLCEQAVMGSDFTDLKEILNKDEYFMIRENSFTNLSKSKDDNPQSYTYSKLTFIIDNVPFCNVEVDRDNNKIISVEFYIYGEKNE